MTFGERLTELRKENGYTTRNKFADKLGIPSTTLRNYETNAREPGHTFLKQISELFNVSVDYLLCLTDEKIIFNAFKICSSEKNLIEKYRDLDDEGRELVDHVLMIEVERSKDLLELRKEQKKRLRTYEKEFEKPYGNRSQT
jgi:transcriptional regulator with XRE-family HTH domain